MYALVDGNNFYCSCERVFNPKLNRRPVIVLSNNDGCAIARSDEAKALGIGMGTPAFMIEPLIRQYNVAVFSSNYTLYGDMSDRMMQILGSFCPRMEIYSIDETFLDLNDLPYTDLLELGLKMRRTVLRHIGIPTSVGIAPTKTLAKMANRYAKKKCRETGVFWAANDELTREMLAVTPIGDVWGIGSQHAAFLKRHGFETAGQFTSAPDDWVRGNMSVVGLRLLHELRGRPSIQPEFEAPDKKNIRTSRSFGTPLSSRADVAEALANFAATCAAKLRAQQSCCRMLEVFLETNPHNRAQPQYMRTIRISPERATNNSPEIIKSALNALELIYKPGYQYKKTGLIAMDLIPETEVQTSMFDTADTTRDKRMMAALDAINSSMGKETLRMATQGFEKRYRLRAQHLSQAYTTNMQQLLKINN